MFDRGTEEDLKASVYIVKPTSIHDMKRLQDYDGYALRAIHDAESMIAQLKEYRMSLYNRAQEIQTAPYHYRLELERDPSWNGKKYYHVRLMKIFDQPGIEPQAEFKQKFAGTERKAAFELFAKMKKERPGVETMQDTDKRNWEK